MEYTLEELAARVSGRVQGDGRQRIAGVGTLTGAGPDEISFLTNSRYRRHLQASRAAAVIMQPADAEGFHGNALLVDNPHVAYAHVAALFAPASTLGEGVHPTADVAASAQLGDGVRIGPHSVIGEGARLGDRVEVGPGCIVGAGVELGADTRLVANVTLYEGCRLGRDCLVHAGAVIGSDGFGFANDAGTWVKVAQLGGVSIGDGVEIGACTTIDRGAIEDTVIEDGVKLDNLIQVAHNVHIGAHTAIAACVGIAGSARIGRHCAIAGGVGILGHLEIADGVVITAMSLVTKSVKKPGSYSAGTPLEPSESWQKNFVRFKQLDDMARRLKSVERELDALKKEVGH